MYTPLSSLPPPSLLPSHERQPPIAELRTTIAIRCSVALLSSGSTCKENFKNLNIEFDFIIDDGLHTPEGQRLTFENFIDFLKPTGSYYIEDVWMLNRNNNMSHWWVKKYPNEFTIEKYNQLIESINKFKVTEYDFSSKKIPDSFILKINK